jgi:hypothetical protein
MVATIDATTPMPVMVRRSIFFMSIRDDKNCQENVDIYSELIHTEALRGGV